MSDKEELTRGMSLRPPLGHNLMTMLMPLVRLRWKLLRLLKTQVILETMPILVKIARMTRRRGPGK
jgi:hypothetical protein